jgi:probable HAF family extracellular repeat protein
MKPQRKTYAAIAVICLSLQTALLADARYQIVDLGSLNGNTVGNFPSAINDSGQVTGYAELSQLVWPHPYLYDGHITPIGADSGQKGRGLAINNLGQIVGDAQAIVPGGYDGFQAFVFAGGQMTNLGTLGGISSQAEGINDHGQIVGWSEYTSPPVIPFPYSGEPPANSYDQPHAFIYQNGSMVDLHLLAGLSGDRSMATDINNHGQIIGSVDDRAFFYSNGQTTDLGTCGQSDCVPLSINDNGSFVILSEDANGVGKGFLYEQGTLTDLGSLGGSQTVPRSINNDGVIVGQSALEGLIPFVLNPNGKPAAGASNLDHTVDLTDSQPIAGFPIWHAFIRENGSLIDLNSLISNDSGWVLTDAGSINAYGQIVGNGTLNGVSHAFLLIPVPEPATSGILAVSLVLLALPRACPRDRWLRIDNWCSVIAEMR